MQRAAILGPFSSRCVGPRGLLLRGLLTGEGRGGGLGHVTAWRWRPDLQQEQHGLEIGSIPVRSPACPHHHLRFDNRPTSRELNVVKGATQEEREGPGEGSAEAAQDEMADRSGFPEFPFPFEPTRAPFDGPLESGVNRPRTLKERLIRHVMASVMRKPQWMAKVQNDEIVERWKAELRASRVPAELDPGFEAGQGSPDTQIGDDVIEYAVSELKWLSKTHQGGDVEPSPVEGVFVIPDATRILDAVGAREPLLEAVRRMEDVPEDKLDYHPGTKKQVVDLVHPSLFCLVYNRTRVISSIPGPLAVLPWEKMIHHVGDSVAQLPDDLEEASDTEFISNKFQWLPAEVDVSPREEGVRPAARFLSYINNLNPREYPELYPALASIFATCFVPLFNKVLTKLVNPWPARVEVDPFAWYDKWEGEREYDKDDDEDYQAWYEDRQPQQPVVPPFQPPPEIPAEQQVELWGRRLQVIVKIAEVRLTPSKPVYPGGTWHVEGMRNEAIVATGIYYFDSENIRDSELAFRQAVDEPSYDQNDDKGVRLIYGLENNKALVQPLGSVPTTSTGLCLAFPNLFHHRVSPFSLADASRPGHRKILAFFLVDPGKSIVSTARVPPQQAAWRQSELERPLHPCSQLPAPALDKVVEHHCEAAGAMSEERAKALRLELMEERKMLLDEATDEILERPFSLCEH